MRWLVFSYTNEENPEQYVQVRRVFGMYWVHKAYLLMRLQLNRVLLKEITEKLKDNRGEFLL